MPNKISPYGFVIHPEGECLFSESSYIISRDDEGAGEYLTISDGVGNKIRVDVDDIDDLFNAIKTLRIAIKNN